MVKAEEEEEEEDYHVGGGMWRTVVPPFIGRGRERKSGTIVQGRIYL